MFRFILPVILAATAAAQTPSYFPLQAGNVWVYRADGPGRQASTAIVSVDRAETIRGREYFLVNFFSREFTLRAEPNGNIISFDRTTGMEQPWLGLAGQAGSDFEAGIDPCSRSGRIVSRDGETRTPAGQFSSVVSARYIPVCADAGVTEQMFAPNVGPVVHEETSIAGSRRFELTYFRSGNTTIAGPEVSFTVATDGVRYVQGGTARVRMTLRSTLADSVTLVFPSGQTFDIKILDENDESVYTWSATRLFLQVIREISFGPGERTYSVEIPIGTIPAGRYRLQAYLTTRPLTYRGETAIEIVNP